MSRPMSAAFDRALPPGDRNDAPIPPPLPVQLSPETHLELGAIRRALETAQPELAALERTLEDGEPAIASAAAIRLLAAFKPDPRVLALRIARTLKGEAS